MYFFFERVITIQNAFYNFVTMELERTSKISNVIKRIREDNDASKIALSYDISQLRTLVKLVKSGIDADAFNIIMYPKKNVKVMTKMGDAVKKAIPLELLSVVSNQPNGKGVAQKQSLILDILNYDYTLFNTSDVENLFRISSDRLVSVKDALAANLSKDSILNIVNCKIDDTQLLQIASNFNANTNEYILSKLLSEDYTTKQLGVLINIMNSSDGNLQKYSEVLLKSDTPVELMETIFKAVNLYNSNSEKLDSVITKLMDSDPNKAKGVFDGLLYGLDESTLESYYNNSIDSASMDELIFAKMNGVSDKNIKRLMELKETSKRKAMRLSVEGIVNTEARKKSIEFVKFDKRVKKPQGKVVSSEVKRKVN